MVNIKELNKKACEGLALDLLLFQPYASYYETVSFDLLIEAVEKALTITSGVCDLDVLHACISENFI